MPNSNPGPNPYWGDILVIVTLAAVLFYSIWVYIGEHG
jgi:hypothetical protein